MLYSGAVTADGHSPMTAFPSPWVESELQSIPSSVPPGSSGEFSAVHSPTLLV